jgi:hypothetical protein
MLLCQSPHLMNVLESQRLRPPLLLDPTDTTTSSSSWNKELRFATMARLDHLHPPSSSCSSSTTTITTIPPRQEPPFKHLSGPLLSVPAQIFYAWSACIELVLPHCPPLQPQKEKLEPISSSIATSTTIPKDTNKEEDGGRNHFRIDCKWGVVHTVASLSICELLHTDLLQRCLAVFPEQAQQRDVAGKIPLHQDLCFLPLTNTGRRNVLVESSCLMAAPFQEQLVFCERKMLTILVGWSELCQG